MSDWLDLELSHELAPTVAPDHLWERLQRTPPSRPKPKWPVAAIAATVVVAATFWMVANGQEPALNLHQLAVRELTAKGPFDIHSHDAREIAAWARREAGVDLALAPGASVELTGARLIRQRGECVAAVSYRIDGHGAALLVARASGPSDAPHRGMSWQHGGQSYALASADSSHAEAACRICHSSL